MTSQAVILAGGMATRMHPATSTTPKSLLPVAGRPFVDWQLARLHRCGFEEVLFCIGHLGEQIQAHVGDGTRYGLRVQYASDGPTLQGTAGALRKALDQLHPTFLMTYGDSYLPFDYKSPLRILNQVNDCEGVMTVYRNHGEYDVSNVITDGVWVSHYQKGGSQNLTCHYIDYGAMALRRSVVESIQPDTLTDLATLQQSLARKGRMRAWVTHLRFFEIGSPAGLEALHQHLQHTSL